MRRQMVTRAIMAASLVGAWLVAGPASPAQAQENAPAVCAPLGELVANARKAPVDDAAYAAQVADGEAAMANVRPLADADLNGLLDALDAFSAEADTAITGAGGVANLMGEQRADLQRRGNDAIAPLAEYEQKNCSPDISGITVIYNQGPCPSATDPEPGPTLEITNARSTGDAVVTHSQTQVTVPASTQLTVTENVERQMTAADITVDGVPLPDSQFAMISTACEPPSTTASPSSGNDAPPTTTKPAPLSPRFTG